MRTNFLAQFQGKSPGLVWTILVKFDDVTPTAVYVVDTCQFALRTAERIRKAHPEVHITIGVDCFVNS